MNRSAALRRGSMEMPFPTSRIGVRRSCKVYGPNARPKLEVKAFHELGGAIVLASRAGNWQVTAREYARPTIEVHGIDARPPMDVQPPQEPEIRSSRRKEAQTYWTEADQSLLTSAATFMFGFPRWRVFY